MLFNSFAYALFFTIVFILYWLMPARFRWMWLLGVSLYFYLSFGGWYICLLIGTALVSYYCAIKVDTVSNARRKRLWLCGGLAIELGVLVIFKYLEFAITSICDVFRFFSIQISPATIRLLLPVGISFYTFQTLGYLIDVYRGKIEAEKHFGHYLLFVSFFPQISSGPIGRADKLLPQFKSISSSGVTFNEGQAAEGVLMLLVGFFKKLVVADTIVVYVDNIYSNVREYSGGALLLAAVLFSIQIYCDFSGYSDMAIGSARLLGVNLMENFRSPYLASSIREFWSRWHISLSTWFRDYVYIPLGGSRCSKLRRDINLILTFLVSGLWHGANWTFIAWGGIHGLGQVIEKRIGELSCKRSGVSEYSSNKLIDRLKKSIGIIFVFTFTSIAWIFFRADSIKDANYVLMNMFDGLGRPIDYLRAGIGEIGIAGNIRLLYILMILVVLFVLDAFNYGGKLYLKVMHMPRVIKWVVIICFSVFTVLFAQKGVAAEFVYIKF